MSRANSSILRIVLFVTLCVAPLVVGGQSQDADWYREFRSWFNSTIPLAERERIDVVAQRYRAKLEAEGVSGAEIDRRMGLLRAQRRELENEFWNRFFTLEKPDFNTEPNAFLVSIVDSRKPGRALDVGMGEGRNALFLAKAGWDVTGFDPADKAVALAAERATAMNLKLQTEIATDTSYDFGDGRWDLILYSWVPPDASAAKAVRSLRPGGVVVVEAGRGWFPPNGLLKLFDSLRIVHYEDRLAQSDYFRRQQMPVVRLVAEKGAP